MNVSMLLDMAADGLGERTALVSGQTRLDYAGLREAVQAAAARFAASGAQYIALIDVNGPALPITLYGAALAGIPFVPLNYRLSAGEIAALLDRIRPALVVAGDAYRELVPDSADLAVIGSDELMVGDSSLAAVPDVETDPTSIAVQLFTSGTTGTPKAALLRHENLVSYILGTVEFAAAAEDEATLISVPPYHIAGIAAALSSTYSGRRVVQLANFEPQAWLDAARAEQVTHAFLVPTMLSRVVELFDADAVSAELPALRAIAYGGGKMPLATIQRAMQLFPGVDFTNAYGLTETSSTIAVLTPDDHRAAAAANDPAIAARLKSVGQPTSAVEVEIRDEAGHCLEPGAVGTIFVRGGQVAGEYREQGSQLDEAGWFCTRDIGYLDDGGYLFLDGRADDVIVRGGENISPGEIEEVLVSHPLVVDAAVVPVPDEQWGEGIAAVLVASPAGRPEVSELRQLVKDRLRSSRVPQLIEFREELPYSELGKLLRRKLRDELAATTGAPA